MKEKFNTDRLMKQVKQLQYVFIVTLALLLLSNAYFAFMWQKEAFSEVTYFVSPEATYPSYAKKTRHEKVRHVWEVENFAKTLVSTTLAHTGETYDDDLEHMLRMIDKESRYRMLKQFIADDLEALYKQHGAMSHIEIEKILVDMKTMPYNVIIVYEFTLRFIGQEEQNPPQKTRGAIYFRAMAVPRNKLNPYGLKATHMKLVEAPPLEEKREKMIQ